MGVLAEESVRIRADTAGFHSEASRGILGSVTRIAGGAAAIFGGIQLGKGLYNATIKSAADFQTTLKVLQATTGASDSSLKRLSETAIKLGADARLPATSAKSAADAMLQLGRAGFSTNQIIDASRGVLLLSTAAEVDNATAADMVTKAIGAFGLQAKDAGTVVNDFAGAANASQSSLHDVGDAVTQAGAGFHALHVPISDAATAIAEMAKQGITGGMAGAALNVAFTRLATPTKAATAVMKDMGVNVFDSSGKFIGLRGAIEQFSPKLAAMTDKQRLHTLSVLGGTRGMKALADVLGVGVKEWDKTHAAVTRAGQAQQIANAKTSGFNGAMLGLQNTLGTLALKIGIAVLPKFTDLLRFLGRVAAAPSFSIAIKILWSGMQEFAGNVEKAISDALFGSSHVVHIGGHSTGVEVDPGLIAKIHKSISDGIAATDWTAVGHSIGGAISAAIKVSSDALNGLLNGMMTWLSAHKNQIADIGVVIGLTMVSKLLDPGFWAAHWQLMGGIALSALSIAFPEGRLAQIGLKAIGFLLKPFEMLGAKLISLGSKAVGDFAISIALRFGPLAGVITKGIGEAVLAATGAVVRFMVDMAGKIIVGFINKIAGLGPIFRTATFTAIVAVIGSIIGTAVSKAVELATSVAHAIMSLPGKLAGLAGQLVGSIVGALTHALGQAVKAATDIADKIAKAIKTAPSKLAGLAGDLVSMIASAAGQAAGQAFTAMRQIGFSIADGVLSGIGNLASRIASKVGGMAKDAASGALSWVQGNSPSKLYADTVGKSIGTGVIVGVEASLSKLGDTTGKILVDLSGRLKVITEKLATDLAASTSKTADKITKAANDKAKPIQDAFGNWVKGAQATFDAQITKLTTSVESWFTSAQAKIDAWKAKATPTEALLAAMQAQAALAAVQLAVASAKQALTDLKVKQDADWAALMATQAANMAALKASLQQSTDSALLSGNTFQKGMAAAATDPLAVALINAQKAFDTTKAMFDAGTATQAEFIAAANVLDDARTAAAADSQATQLLDQYNTWQAALKQEADAGAAITTQEATDQAAQAAQRTTNYNDWLTASKAVGDALLAETQYHLEQEAITERTARDKAAEVLSAALKHRHDRILEHLNNVQHAWDIHFDKLAKDATKSGGDITDNIANALKRGIPTVAGAAAAVAKVIADYLKLKSPARAGPMSDLDQWWTQLAPTLVASLDTGTIKAALGDALTPALAGARPGAPVTPAGASLPMRVSLDENVSRDLRELVAVLKRQEPSTPVTVIATGGADAAVYAAKR